jgi:hypothetical protein
VQGFALHPSQPRGKWQVSTAGGASTLAHDGKTVLLPAGTHGRRREPTARRSKPAFPGPVRVRVPIGGRNHFVATKDGQRWLSHRCKKPTTRLQVLVNWQ